MKLFLRKLTKSDSSAKSSVLDYVRQSTNFRSVAASFSAKGLVRPLVNNETYLKLLYDPELRNTHSVKEIYNELKHMYSIDPPVLHALKELSYWYYLRLQVLQVFKTSILKNLFYLLLAYYLYTISSQLYDSSSSIGFLKSTDKVLFADLIGIDEFKEELVQIVDFLRNREEYTRIGANVPRGVLLSGPPGCGKTQLARAVSCEADMPFISINCSELILPITGKSQEKIQELFKKARSSKKGCIIFIDEIDSLQSRDRFSGSYNSIQNELLTQMDGFVSSENILIIAATNREEVLDQALTRSGRFDFKVRIKLPMYQNRIDLLDYYLKKVKHGEIDRENFARLTVRFSPADIKNLINKAAYRAVEKGRFTVLNEDMVEAFERVKLGVKTHDFDGNAFQQQAALKEAAKAVYCIGNDQLPTLKKISLAAFGGEVTGKSILVDKIDSTNYTKEELLARISYYLVPKVIEDLVYNPDQRTTLPQNDLAQSSSIAVRYIGELGMDEDFSLSIPNERVLSERGKYEINERADELMKQLYLEIKKRLTPELDKIKKLQEALLLKEELKYEEVLEVLKSD